MAKERRNPRRRGAEPNTHPYEQRGASPTRQRTGGSGAGWIVLVILLLIAGAVIWWLVANNNDDSDTGGIDPTPSVSISSGLPTESG